VNGATTTLSKDHNIIERFKGGHRASSASDTIRSEENAYWSGQLDQLAPQVERPIADPPAGLRMVLSVTSDVK
jgi:hypothetical protein